MKAHRQTQVALKYLAIVLVVFLLVPSAAQAFSGLPNSPLFGFGVRIDPYGELTTASIATAAAQKMDWIAIDFDWTRQSQGESGNLDLSLIDPLIDQARTHELNVLLAITHPPAWVLSSSGPDAARVSELVTTLVDRYNGIVLAVELFPGANTSSLWGAYPNPQAYLNMLYLAQTGLYDKGLKAIVIPSVTPIDPAQPENNIDDLAFINALYNNNGLPFMQVIGIRYNRIVGDVMAPPDPAQREILRHYEEVRSLMLEHNHQEGKIWITGFSWVAQTNSQGSALTMEEQALWLTQSFQLLRGQLFIGAAFFDYGNPSNVSSEQTHPTLLLADSNPHPAFQMIAQVISGEKIGATLPDDNYPGNISNELKKFKFNDWKPCKS